MADGIRLSVIGVGSIGERHVRCFQNTGRVTISICEPNDELRRRVAESYSIQDAFEDLEPVLSDPPDGVVICTPAHLHIPIARRFAEAKVHLLIEKPLSIHLDGVAELTRLVERERLVCGVAYVNRVHPILVNFRRALHSGRFGKPVQLTMIAGQHFPYYRPAYREIYYNNRATGGGAIQDSLTHMVNAGEWLVGPMSEVAADAEHQVLEGVDVEDTVHVIARHGEVQASFCLNQHQAANESIMTLVCERGMLRLEIQQSRWRWTVEPEAPWHDELHPPIERDELFVRQADMFLDAMEHTAPLACPLSDGLQTLRSNLAILKAAESRTWQTVQGADPPNQLDSVTMQ